MGPILSSEEELVKVSGTVSCSQYHLMCDGKLRRLGFTEATGLLQGTGTTEGSRSLYVRIGYDPSSRLVSQTFIETTVDIYI